MVVIEILADNGEWHDYSPWVERSGMGWKRNAIDSDKTNRNPMNGLMNRYVVGNKRTVSFKILEMPREKLAQLDTDLDRKFFKARYLDLHGVQTREFYCSSFSTTLEVVDGENSLWGDGAFTMIER